jgi:hypothetical protein
MSGSSRDADRISSAQQTLDSGFFRSSQCIRSSPAVLHEMSQLLNTQLDKETVRPKRVCEHY